MSIEIAGFLITTLGVVIAFLAWWFPMHKKATINLAHIKVTQHEPLADPDYRKQIEVAHMHLDASTFRI